MPKPPVHTQGCYAHLGYPPHFDVDGARFTYLTTGHSRMIYRPSSPNGHALKVHPGPGSTHYKKSTQYNAKENTALSHIDCINESTPPCARLCGNPQFHRRILVRFQSEFGKWDVMGALIVSYQGIDLTIAAKVLSLGEFCGAYISLVQNVRKLAMFGIFAPDLFGSDCTLVNTKPIAAFPCNFGQATQIDRCTDRLMRNSLQ